MILGTSRGVRVYAYPEAVDLRKGYDGLFGLVKQGLGRDPLSGDLFLFVNARRKGCKVLVWDGTGLCIFQKRLASPSYGATTAMSSRSHRASSHSSSKAASSSAIASCRQSPSCRRHSLAEIEKRRASRSTVAWSILKCPPWIYGAKRTSSSFVDVECERCDHCRMRFVSTVMPLVIVVWTCPDSWTV